MVFTNCMAWSCICGPYISDLIDGRTKYIFKSVLSIFEEGISNNIFLMSTFADGQKPRIPKAAREGGVFFFSDISHSTILLYLQTMLILIALMKCTGKWHLRASIVSLIIYRQLNRAVYTSLEMF